MILHRMPSLGVSSLDLGRFRVAFFLRRGGVTKPEQLLEGKPSAQDFGSFAY
jgi:hypothetical protein